MTRARALVAALLAVTLLSSCDSSPSDTRPTGVAAEKAGSGERRGDLEPLVTRFAALGQPTSATWYSGTLGDADVPGPSSYWIDAVVTLTPKAADSLVTRHAAQPTETRPETVPELEGDLPPGELLRSPELDSAFSTTFSTQVWISPESGQVVLTAKGQ